MTDKVQHLEVGDTLEISVKGKIVETGTPGAVTLRIDRPGKRNPYSWEQEEIGGYRVSVVLDEYSEIKTEVKSHYRNGVHIGDDGRYYMRKPDGWYPMEVQAKLMNQAAPGKVQRLVEAKDK